MITKCPILQIKKTTLIMLPVLLVYTTAQVNFEQIHGNLYREELGQITVYDEEWNLITGTNITNTHERMTIISNLRIFYHKIATTTVPYDLQFRT